MSTWTEVSDVLRKSQLLNELCLSCGLEKQFQFSDTDTMHSNIIKLYVELLDEKDVEIISHYNLEHLFTQLNKQQLSSVLQFNIASIEKGEWCIVFQSRSSKTLSSIQEAESSTKISRPDLSTRYMIKVDGSIFQESIQTTSSFLPSSTSSSSLSSRSPIYSATSTASFFLTEIMSPLASAFPFSSLTAATSPTEPSQEIESPRTPNSRQSSLNNVGILIFRGIYHPKTNNVMLHEKIGMSNFGYYWIPLKPTFCSMTSKAFDWTSWYKEHLNPQNESGVRIVQCDRIGRRNKEFRIYYSGGLSIPCLLKQVSIQQMTHLDIDPVLSPNRNEEENDAKYPRYMGFSLSPRPYEQPSIQTIFNDIVGEQLVSMAATRSLWFIPVTSKYTNWLIDSSSSLPSIHSFNTTSLNPRDDLQWISYIKCYPMMISKDVWSVEQIIPIHSYEFPLWIPRMDDSNALKAWMVSKFPIHPLYLTSYQTKKQAASQSTALLFQSFFLQSKQVGPNYSFHDMNKMGLNKMGLNEMGLNEPSADEKTSHQEEQVERCLCGIEFCSSCQQLLENVYLMINPIREETEKKEKSVFRLAELGQDELLFITNGSNLIEQHVGRIADRFIILSPNKIFVQNVILAEQEIWKTRSNKFPCILQCNTFLEDYHDTFIRLQIDGGLKANGVRYVLLDTSITSQMMETKSDMCRYALFLRYIIAERGRLFMMFQQPVSRESCLYEIMKDLGFKHLPTKSKTRLLFEEERVGWFQDPATFFRVSKSHEQKKDKRKRKDKSSKESKKETSVNMTIAIEKWLRLGTQRQMDIQSELINKEKTFSKRAFMECFDALSTSITYWKQKNKTSSESPHLLIGHDNFLHMKNEGEEDDSKELSSLKNKVKIREQDNDQEWEKIPCEEGMKIRDEKNQIYTVKSQIGKGGLGSVYHVVMNSTGISYAMKGPICCLDTKQYMTKEFEEKRTLGEMEIIEEIKFYTNKRVSSLLGTALPNVHFCGTIKVLKNGLRYQYSQVPEKANYMFPAIIMDLKGQNLLTWIDSKNYQTKKFYDQKFRSLAHVQQTIKKNRQHPMYSKWTSQLEERMKQINNTKIVPEYNVWKTCDYVFFDRYNVEFTKYMNGIYGAAWHDYDIWNLIEIFRAQLVCITLLHGEDFVHTDLKPGQYVFEHEFRTRLAGCLLPISLLDMASSYHVPNSAFMDKETKGVATIIYQPDVCHEWMNSKFYGFPDDLIEWIFGLLLALGVCPWYDIHIREHKSTKNKQLTEHVKRMWIKAMMNGLNDKEPVDNSSYSRYSRSYHLLFPKKLAEDKDDYWTPEKGPSLFEQTKLESSSSSLSSSSSSATASSSSSSASASSIESTKKEVDDEIISLFFPCYNDAFYAKPPGKFQQLFQSIVWCCMHDTDTTRFKDYDLFHRRLDMLECIDVRPTNWYVRMPLAQPLQFPRSSFPSFFFSIPSSSSSSSSSSRSSSFMSSSVAEESYHLLDMSGVSIEIDRKISGYQTKRREFSPSMNFRYLVISYKQDAAKTLSELKKIIKQEDDKINSLMKMGAILPFVTHLSQLEPKPVVYILDKKKWQEFIQSCSSVTGLELSLQLWKSRSDSYLTSAATFLAEESKKKKIVQPVQTRTTETNGWKDWLDIALPMISPMASSIAQTQRSQPGQQPKILDVCESFIQNTVFHNMRRKCLGTIKQQYHDSILLCVETLTLSPSSSSSASSSNHSFTSEQIKMIQSKLPSYVSSTVREHRIVNVTDGYLVDQALI